MTKIYPTTEMTAAMVRVLESMADEWTVYTRSDETMELVQKATGVHIAVFPEKPPFVVQRDGMYEPKNYVGYCSGVVDVDNGDIIVSGVAQYRVSQIEEWGSFRTLRLVVNSIELNS